MLFFISTLKTVSKENQSWCFFCNKGNYICLLPDLISTAMTNKNSQLKKNFNIFKGVNISHTPQSLVYCYHGFMFMFRCSVQRLADNCGWFPIERAFPGEIGNIVGAVRNILALHV